MFEKLCRDGILSWKPGLSFFWPLLPNSFRREGAETWLRTVKWDREEQRFSLPAYVRGSPGAPAGTSLLGRRPQPSSHSQLLCPPSGKEKEMANPPVFLPGKSHELRILVGYRPWGRKELDMTERLHFTSSQKAWIPVLPWTWNLS